MVALWARQLCLGKVGDPANFGANPCCHGNEILARRRDPVAYRLVYLSVCLYVCLYVVCMCRMEEEKDCEYQDLKRKYLSCLQELVTSGEGQQFVLYTVYVSDVSK